MNEQELKLQQVKKSCKTISTVIKVLKILVVAIFVVFLVAGIVCYNVDNTFVTDAIRSRMNINSMDVNIRLESHIGAFRIDPQAFLEHGGLAVLIAAYCIIGAIAVAIVEVILWFMGSIFKEIQESETPFSEAVIKKLKITLIVISLLVFISSGIASGAIAGLASWCIYTIFQYGFVLQKQSDETL